MKTKLLSSAHSDVGQRRRQNEDRFFASDELGLYVVCDGMGGHRSGALAAVCACEAFVSAIRSGKTPREAGVAADIAVRAIEGDDGSMHRSPGSTLTAIIISDAGAQVAHVGDSEAWRMSADGYFQKITRDHSGMFGLDNFCGLGTNHGQFFVDVTGKEANPGDRFIIASDGLNKHVSERELQTIWQDTRTESLARGLVDLCNERGGVDNITVICVEVLP